MKILITGSTGFVGRNVKEYLNKLGKYQVYAPTSKELNCLDEQAVTEFLKENRFECILHFAVYGDAIDKTKDGSRIVDCNLRIFLNFAKNSHLYGKMYYTGSGAEYDKRYDISLVREEDVGKTIPIDSYGLMKYTVGRFIEESNCIYNLRLFGVFGKYEYYPTKYISNVCCKAIYDIPLFMRQNVYFDYLWIHDFCRIVDWFIEHEPRYHTYNIVSGERVSLQEICDNVKKISGKELAVIRGREGLAPEYTASNKRFLDEYKEFSFTPIKKSIRNLYQWYEENQEKIDKYALLYGKGGN